MAYIICEPCVGTKDTACVDACPVDCIHPPSPEFSKQAHIHSRDVYDSLTKRATEDPEGFWAEIAADLHWFEPWKTVLEWNAPFSKWFVGGKTNISYNCLDRHLTGTRK